jgi:hypothetical protein
MRPSISRKMTCDQAHSLRWKATAESTIRWFVVREKHCSDWKNKLKSIDYKISKQGQRGIARDQLKLHATLKTKGVFSDELIDSGLSRFLLFPIQTSGLCLCFHVENYFADKSGKISKWRLWRTKCPKGLVSNWSTKSKKGKNITDYCFKNGMS